MANEIVKLEFNKDQVELIRSQIAPKASDEELKLFIYQAKRTGLDPMARQIYAIHRRAKDHNGNWVDKMTIQVSIDGFRVIAERSGSYAGQDEPMFLTDEKGKLYCKVSVYRWHSNSRYVAAVGVAYWDEYVQADKDGKPLGLWAKMPRTMLAKVAEALALRKAYPQDLSGLYTGEEMDQQDSQEAIIVEPIEGIEPKKVDVKPDKDTREYLDEDHPKWAQVVEAIKANYTIDQVKKRFKLSDRILEELNRIKSNKTQIA